jgi:hypothetical protein
MAHLADAADGPLLLMPGVRKIFCYALEAIGSGPDSIYLLRPGGGAGFRCAMAVLEPDCPYEPPRDPNDHADGPLSWLLKEDPWEFWDNLYGPFVEGPPRPWLKEDPQDFLFLPYRGLLQATRETVRFLKESLKRRCAQDDQPKEQSVPTEGVGNLQELAGEAEKPDARSDVARSPLTPRALAVLELLEALPPRQGMNGPQILEALEKKRIFVDQSTLTKNIIPALKPYGVENKRGVGYFIRKPAANSPF